MRYRKLKGRLIHLVNARLAYSEYKRVTKDYSLKDIPLVLDALYYSFYQTANRANIIGKRDKVKHLKDLLLIIVRIRLLLLQIKIRKE